MRHTSQGSLNVVLYIPVWSLTLQSKTEGRCTMHTTITQPPVPEGDTLESLGLSGSTMLQLWAIGVARISDLTGQNSDCLRKKLAVSFDGSYGSKKRVEIVIQELSAALVAKRKSLKELEEKPHNAVEEHRGAGVTVPQRSDEPPEHAVLDSMNAKAPRYSADSMQVFYRDMRQYRRILSRDEQNELGRRVAEEKDMAARDILVHHNLRLVLWVARKQLWATIARRSEWSALEFSDLVQEGVIGLMIAAEKYDYRQGFAFSTYAQWWIKQGISRAIMDSGFIRIPVHLGELISKIHRATNEIALREGRPPTITEIATSVEKTPKEVKNAMRVARMELSSFDEPITPSGKLSGSTAGNWHEHIADSGTLGADRMLEACDELNDACGRLNDLTEALYGDDSIAERNREIFTHFYGLDGSLKKRTLEHAAERFAITRERIRQIIQTCWDKLQDSGIDMDHDSVVEELWRIGELETLTGKRVSVD